MTRTKILMLFAMLLAGLTTTRADWNVTSYTAISRTYNGTPQTFELQSLTSNCGNANGNRTIGGSYLKYESGTLTATNAGTYYVTLRNVCTGTDHSGTHLFTWTISPKNISDATISTPAENMMILPNGAVPPLTPTITVKDGTKELVAGTDYTIDLYSNSDRTTSTTITQAGIYYARIKGKSNYTGTKDLTLYVLNEYYAGSNNSSGADIHVTEIDEDGTPICKLGNATNTAVFGSSSLTIQAQPTITIDSETVTLKLTGIETKAFKDLTTLTAIDMNAIATLTDIENGAFEGCTGLRYIDLSAATGFSPTSLERNQKISEAPFYGVPKQALIFLNSADVHGENYVYRPGSGTDYFCEKFKIYDDLSGSQTNFSETKGEQWAFTNPHPFTAYVVENTRVMTMWRHYTVCLPYDLPLPPTLKAYSLNGENSSSTTKLIGFKEHTGTLARLTPYLVIPSASGQQLNTTNAVVGEFTTEGDAAQTLNEVATTNCKMYATMRYISNANAAGKYIMQYYQNEPTWMQVSTSNANAYILPMRAYISYSGSSPARRYSISLTDSNGTTHIIELMNNEEDSTLNDLQGHRITQPVAPGIYISNGKKTVIRK